MDAQAPATASELLVADEDSSAAKAAPSRQLQARRSAAAAAVKCKPMVVEAPPPRPWLSSVTMAIDSACGSWAPAPVLGGSSQPDSAYSRYTMPVKPEEGDQEMAETEEASIRMREAAMAAEAIAAVRRGQEAAVVAKEGRGEVRRGRAGRCGAGCGREARRCCGACGSARGDGEAQEEQGRQEEEMRSKKHF